MNCFALYLLTRCESLRSYAQGALGFGAIVLMMGGLILGMAHDEMQPETFKASLRYFKISLAASFLSSLLLVVVPTERELAIIIAGHWASNSEEMKRLPDNVAKTLNSLLDKANEKLQEGK